MHWKHPRPIHSSHEPLKGPWQELFALFFGEVLLFLLNTLWQVFWAVSTRQLRN